MKSNALVGSENSGIIDALDNFTITTNYEQY